MCINTTPNIFLDWKAWNKPLVPQLVRTNALIYPVWVPYRKAFIQVMPFGGLCYGKSRSRWIQIEFRKNGIKLGSIIWMNCNYIQHNLNYE